MKTPKAPAPDPLQRQLAVQNAQIGEAQLLLAEESMDLAREQYEDQKKEAERLAPIYDRLAESQIEATEQASDISRQSWDDYNRLYRPLEERVVYDAEQAGTAEEQERAAGLAGVDVQRQLDMQREVGARQMASMGVRPDSGRFAGQNRTEAIMGAAARAGAQTAARAAEKLRGDQMRSAAAALGKGMSSTALTGIQVQGSAGGQAANMAGMSADRRSAAGQQMLGNMSGSSGLMGNAAGTNQMAGGQFSQLFNDRLSGWKAQQEAKNAQMQAMGSMAGSAMMFMSSKRVKHHKRPFNSASARRIIESLPIERWKYKPGTPYTDADTGREHVGPYAEDWHKKTGLGDGRAISVIDAVGVNMAATKALSRDVKGLRRQIAGLGARAGA